MIDIPVSYFTPEQCTAITKSALPLVEGKFPNDPYVCNLVALTKSHNSTLAQSMAISKKSEFTKQFEDADAEFDEAFITFRDHTSSTSRLHKKPEKAEPAKKIDFVIGKHGKSLYNLNRQEQIGRMDALAEELNTPEMQELLIAADLKDLYDDVIEKHQAFVELHTIKAKTESNSQVPPPGDSKKPLAYDLSDLYSYFTRSVRCMGDQYKEVATQLELIFANVVPTARARRHRGSQPAIVVEQETAPAE